jgi:hypothetical protein
MNRSYNRRNRIPRNSNPFGIRLHFGDNTFVRKEPEEKTKEQLIEDLEFERRNLMQSVADHHNCTNKLNREIEDLKDDIIFLTKKYNLSEKIRIHNEEELDQYREDFKETVHPYFRDDVSVMNNKDAEEIREIYEEAFDKANEVRSRGKPKWMDGLKKVGEEVEEEEKIPSGWVLKDEAPKEETTEKPEEQE